MGSRPHLTKSNLGGVNQPYPSLKLSKSPHAGGYPTKSKAMRYSAILGKPGYANLPETTQTYLYLGEPIGGGVGWGAPLPQTDTPENRHAWRMERPRLARTNEPEGASPPRDRSAWGSLRRNPGDRERDTRRPQGLRPTAEAIGGVIGGGGGESNPTCLGTYGWPRSKPLAPMLGMPAPDPPTLPVR